MKKLFFVLALLLSCGVLRAQQPVKNDDGVGNPLTSTNNALDVNLKALAAPTIVQSAGANVGGTTVKTLSTTLSATKAGNTLVVQWCAGEAANGSSIILIVSDTQSDSFRSAANQNFSTTFGCTTLYATNISAGTTTVTGTYSGASSANTSIAMYVYEVSGLMTVAPAVLDTSTTGTATSTTLLAGSVMPTAPNDYAFVVYGVGTAAQTVSPQGSGSWSNDSGQVNPSSASGLFSFVSESQFLPADVPIQGQALITSEPWVAVLTLFRPVPLTVAETIVEPATTANYTTPVCTAAMTGTSNTVTIAAPGAGLHNYITSIMVTNSHATVGTFVTVNDGSGGTILWEGYAAAVGGGFAISFSTPIRQTTANNGLFVADVTTGANVIACATGFTGP